MIKIVIKFCYTSLVFFNASGLIYASRGFCCIIDMILVNCLFISSRIELISTLRTLFSFSSSISLVYSLFKFTGNAHLEQKFIPMLMDSEHRVTIVMEEMDIASKEC
jgi:hypothetical protein